jgi:arginase
MMPYLCIGVPYWIGERQSVSAVDAIKESGLAAEIGTDWIDIQPDFMTYPDPVIAVNNALAGVIAAYPQHTFLIFAADCVSSLGVMKGLEDRKPAVLWYDAHGDFNTPETSPSGFLGGMPLAALVGRENEALVQGIGLTPLAENEVIITDARDLDPEESIALAASGIIHLKHIDELLTCILPGKPLYIHFDTDVVNHDEMPAMNYPAVGGPSMAQTIATLERVGRDADVAAILFSLWNHTLNDAKMSLENTLKLVRAFVGAQAER